MGDRGALCAPVAIMALVCTIIAGKVCLPSLDGIALLLGFEQLLSEGLMLQGGFWGGWSGRCVSCVSTPMENVCLLQKVQNICSTCMLWRQKRLIEPKEICQIKQRMTSIDGLGV